MEGSKFTVFALFYFVFEGNFQSTNPPGGLYLEGRFNRGVFCVTGLGGLYLEGLIHRGAYFRNFTVHNYSDRRTLSFLNKVSCNECKQRGTFVILKINLFRLIGSFGLIILLQVWLTSRLIY